MKQSTKSRAEELLRRDLQAACMTPVVGHQFHSERGWKFDLAYPRLSPSPLAIEIEGRGRHQTEKGEREDMEKYNAAIELGWRILIYPAKSVTYNNRRANIVEQIRRVVCGVVCEDSMTCVLVGE